MKIDFEKQFCFPQFKVRYIRSALPLVINQTQVISSMLYFTTGFWPLVCDIGKDYPADFHLCLSILFPKVWPWQMASPILIFLIRFFDTVLDSLCKLLCIQAVVLCITVSLFFFFHEKKEGLQLSG